MAKEILKRLMFNAGVKTCNTIGDGIAAVLSGDTLVVIEGIEQANLVSSKGFKDRGVEEPATENNVRGPRDGFTESLRTNTALVRRRIKDPMLRLDAMVIGTRSKTDINIAYIQDLVKEGLVEVVKQRLGRIKIDAILESGYIEELIEDAPLSPFDTVQSTERPDEVASALLEGRVAILTDNTPHDVFRTVVARAFAPLLRRTLLGAGQSFSPFRAAGFAAATTLMDEGSTTVIAQDTVRMSDQQKPE
ncbi:hypothetical protein J2X61_000588 [Bacillus sp. 3255]|nr:hypothetical protein [Bacillus sp. 3255]